METVIRFEMKGNDARLLSEIKEPVKIVDNSGYSVEGLVIPKTWYSWNEIECDVLEKEHGISNITIPVKSLWVSRNYRDEIQEVHDMAGNVYYFTAADRARYRALEGLRAYRETLTACTYVFEREYEDEFGKFTSCGHGPNSHGPDGCKEILYWDGAGYDSWPIYCPCEGYTKPAPLMVISEIAA